MPLRIEVPALWLTYSAAAALSVWLARRFVGAVTARAAILLAAGPLLFTGKAMLLGQLYGPADLYYGAPPWSAIAQDRGGVTIANPILSDLAFANLPWRAAVREAIVNGRMPFWNRFVLAGSPLLASAQAAIFHPSTWVGIFLPLPLSWTFSCTFTIFLALLGAFLFFRDFALCETAALVGAAGWGFSTYLVFWDGWSVGTSIAAFPLLLLGLRRLSRSAPGASLVTVVAFLLLIAGGHPETWFHAVAAAAAFFLWELLARRRKGASRAMAKAAAAGLVGVLLCAPQLFPFLEALPHSAEYRARREALRSSESSSQAVGLAEASRRLLPALLPFAHGIYGKSPVQSQREDGSGVPLAYAGAMLFPLAVLGLFGAGRPGRETTIFILLCVFGLLAGASAPGLLDLLSRLPGFAMALNYRLVFLVSLGLAGLAAFGAESLACGEAKRGARIAAGCTVLLLASFAAARGVFLERALPADFVRASLLVEVVPILLLAVLCAWPRLPARRAAAGALLLLCAQRGLEMSGTYPTLPARDLSAPLPELAAVAGPPARVVALGDVFRPNAAALYGVEDVRGYESVVLDRFADTFPLWSSPQFASFNRVDRLDRPFLAFLNVRFAIGAPQVPAPADWRTITEGRDDAIFENPSACARAFVPPWILGQSDPTRTVSDMGAARDLARTVWVEESASQAPRENGSALLELRESGPDLIVAGEAASRALVATSIPAWPGWRAESGSRDLPLVTVDHAFVGFFLPSGRSLVRLHYRPACWNASLAAFAAGLLIAALGSRQSFALWSRLGIRLGSYWDDRRTR